MTLLPGTREDASVFARFARISALYPDRPFLAVLPETAAAYGIEAGEISYAVAAARIAQLEAQYRKAGYGIGHRVGLLLQNRPDFLFHWFALNALGASVVPINPDLRMAELEYLIAHSEMVLTIATPDRRDDLTGAATGPLAVIAPDAMPPFAPTPAGAGAIGRSLECALLYTSGTTGRPKGCVLANDYFLLAGEWYASVGDLCSLAPDPAERMLTPLPVFHMNAMAYSLTASVTVGGCLCILDRFHPGSWWQSVADFDATVIHYLGVMPAMLMKAAPGAADRAHRVRFGFGAGVDRALHAPFEERFGFPLLEAWAMTETGAGAVVIASRAPRQIGTNCFGAPGPDVEVSIRAEHGGEAGIEEPGELLVRHAGEDPRRGFFREYLKDPEATAVAWTGGWFHTGDVVRRDAEGQLHFVDRKKNVIRRSGENIAAIEVESVLGKHPAVAQVAVAPVPDPMRGEEVVALIVPAAPDAGQDAGPLLAEEIVRHCLTQLAYYKAPGYVAFVEAIPLTSTAKIQRGALRGAVDAAIAAGQAIDTRALKKRSA